MLDREILRHQLNVLIISKIEIGHAHSLPSQGPLLTPSTPALFPAANASATGTTRFIILLFVLILVGDRLSIVGRLQLPCHLLRVDAWLLGGRTTRTACPNWRQLHLFILRLLFDFGFLLDSGSRDRRLLCFSLTVLLLLGLFHHF